MVLEPMFIINRFVEILTAPAKDFEILWIIIPIYLSGIFSDYYEEKKSTALGRAVSNGFVALWVGIDWGRQLTDKINLSAVTTLNIVQGILAVSLIAYGVFIMTEGIRGKSLTHYVGRIREVTYIIVCITPIFYGIVPADLETVIAIIVFLPVWYLVWELIMRVLPTPSIEEEGGEMAGMGKEAEIPGTEGLPGMEEPKQDQSLFPQQPQQGYPPQYPQQGYPPQYPQQGYPPNYPY